jgi:CBS domain-containing protein
MARVTELMTPNPTAVEPSTIVSEAAKKMAQEDVGPLPVVEDGKLVGIVTDRDLVLRVLAEGRDPETTKVGDVASRSPVTVEPQEDLDRALQLMAQHRVRRLPVVEDGKLVGIVAQADVARHGDEERTGEVVQEISS